MHERNREMRADEPQPRPASAADSARYPPRAAPPAYGKADAATTSAESLPALYRALLDADDRGDAVALARIGWLLFAMTSATQQAHLEAVAAERTARRRPRCRRR